MATPISNIPLLLFPLKLETRFVGDALWIRAFPDEAFVQSHDPLLSAEEREAAASFKAITSVGQKKPAWDALVSRYGVYRASWIAQITKAELDRQQADNKQKEKEPSFTLKWLPDRLVFYIYKEGDQKPSYQGDGSVINREGLTLLGDGDAWLQDFDKAIQAGMGIKIKINPQDTKFERVIVSGFRYDSDPVTPAKGLADLFDNHGYTEGFSFLKYGTPTNNTDKATSGHSAREEFEVADSFEYAVTGLDLEREVIPEVPDVNTATAGKLLSRSLGFETDHLKHVRNADQSPLLLNELYQKATWFALGAQPLFMLFGNHISSEVHESLWQHYSKYVKGRGLYSALKIGNQPYGVLPVMNISNVLLPENADTQQSDQMFDKMMVILAHLLKRWRVMAKGDPQQLPRLMGNDSFEDVLRILSMQESSSRYQIRPLEYRSVKKKMYDKLKDRTASQPVLEFLKSMGQDYENVQENLTSLVNLLGRNNAEFTAEIDQLLRAQLLSFTESTTNLIGFADNVSVVTDQEGNVVGDDSADNFLFVQDDLANFQEFINNLKNQKPDELIQYKGDHSVFTDLFVRSYINASQLYAREITFEPSFADTTSGSRLFKITTIEKAEGLAVKKGDAIMTVTDVEGKTITVTAPFEGKIKKVQVATDEEILAGTPLLTLVNESKRTKIKNDFVALGQQIIEAGNAIAEVNERTDAMSKALGEVIDLNSYRIDAWITSLAARRLDEMRSKAAYEKGIYFGAYGWIEDLQRDDAPVNAATLTDIYREKGGMIHSPGPAQTVAASVFKNSFLSHLHEPNSNPFTVNLTSDRLQKGQLLLDGIRQGQQLEALLGYQLERYLHESDLHQEIYALRESFPLYENATANNKGFVNLSVVDGLKAIRNKTTLSVQVQKHVEKLEDTLDASLDTLFFETGYQVTQGNLSQAAAAMSATKGELEPPVIESLKTRIPGTGINHKLVMLLPSTTDAYPIENARAFVEPRLEKWLQESVGSMAKIGCKVELYHRENLLETKEITLAALNIGYLDLLYASDHDVATGSSELELRIRNALTVAVSADEELRYVITDSGAANTLSLSKALEVARYAKTLLSKCRYLKSDDLTLDGETIKHDKAALDAIRDDRLRPVIERLKAIAKSDLTQPNTLAFLANLDFESAKTAFLQRSSIETPKLKATIETKVASAEALLKKYNDQLPYYSAFDILLEVARLLFGQPFLLVPPCMAADNVVQVIKAKKQMLLVGDPADETTEQVWGQERIRTWIQGVAQVQENTEAFEDWQMVQHVWNQQMRLSQAYGYHVVQGPTLLKYPWVALSKQEIDQLLAKQYASQPIYTDPETGKPYPLDDNYYPDNCDSIVVYSPSSTVWDKPVYGLVIDEFPEHIPDKTVNTGLSFHYNIPNNEPPQAILLALHPKATMTADFFWSENDLRDILYDTMDLYKTRMVDLEAMQEYGYLLPMTYWFNIPAYK